MRPAAALSANPRDKGSSKPTNSNKKPAHENDCPYSSAICHHIPFSRSFQPPRFFDLRCWSKIADHDPASAKVRTDRSHPKRSARFRNAFAWRTGRRLGRERTWRSFG